MTKQKYCSGCYNDVYNRGCGGSKQCWSLEKAKVVWRKAVHINQMPPWKQKAIRTLNCYNKPQWVYVGAKQET